MVQLCRVLTAKAAKPQMAGAKALVRKPTKTAAKELPAHAVTKAEGDGDVPWPQAP